MASQLVPRLLKKALDLVTADPARAWTVGEIASACGMSRRTLERQFRRFVGRMPMEFLRDLRLNNAREELLRGSGYASVTEIAISSGFNHLGRFAARYRNRFGESPSITLRRGQAATMCPDRAPPPVLIAVNRPTIAVLPFDLIGRDARCAAGMAEEIAAAIMRLRWLVVGAPDSAHYHLRGKVVDDGTGRLRVRVILLDAPTGRYLWADRWESDYNNIFDLEERVATRIRSTIQPIVREAEIDRASRYDPARLNAWELTMRALPRVLKVEPAAEQMALELLEKAMEVAADDALPVSLAAWCHGLRGCHNFCPRPDTEKTVAAALAKRAAQLGAGDALTEIFLTAAYTLADDLPTAANHAERALALDGGSAWAWGRTGWIKAYGGEAVEAIECFQIARTLAPVDPLQFLWSVGIAAGHFGMSCYDKSARWFERALAENPAAVWINHSLAPAYAMGGRKEAAQRCVTELTRTFPDLTIAKVRGGLPFRSNFLDRVAEGLESAGMRAH